MNWNVKTRIVISGYVSHADGIVDGDEEENNKDHSSVLTYKNKIIVISNLNNRFRFIRTGCSNKEN